MEAGFCGNRITNVEEMTGETGDSIVRSQVMSMIERCPSGSFMYALRHGDRPGNRAGSSPSRSQSWSRSPTKGPIRGPLWVTGNIPILRSDGQPFEVRMGDFVQLWEVIGQTAMR